MLTIEIYNKSFKVIGFSYRKPSFVVLAIKENSQKLQKKDGSKRKTLAIDALRWVTVLIK